MTIALDPTKDVLVPVKTFKQLASANKFDEYEELAGEVQEHLNLKENQIESDAKYKFLKKDSDEFKALERGFKQLDDRIRGFPDNQELWLIRCFLAPFEGRITEPAKMIWEALGTASDKYSLREVEREARALQETRKKNYQALATACQALQTSCTAVSDALSPFTAALTAGGVGPTTGAPATAPTLANIKTNLAKPDNSEVLRVLGIAAPEQVSGLAWEDSGSTEGLRNRFRRARLSGSEIAGKFLKDNGIVLVGGADLPETLSESKILKNLKQEKKLYLAGFSSKSEYLARLLEAKIILNEATPAEIDAEKLRMKTFIDSIIYNLVPAGTVAVGLQDGLTKINQTLERLQESLKRLKTTKMLHSKGLISNTEYMATLVEVKKNIEENKKIQLNEFFLITALFAALGAVFGWFTAKWAANRFGAYGGGNHNDRRGNNNKVADEKQSQQSVTSILAGLGGGLDPEGRVVSVDGRPAPNPTEELKKLKESIRNNKANVTAIVRDATAILNAGPPTISDRLGASTNQDQINKTGAALLSTITTQDLVVKVTAVENGITTLEGTP